MIRDTKFRVENLETANHGCDVQRKNPNLLLGVQDSVLLTRRAKLLMVTV